MIVTVTIMGQFTIEANDEESYQKKLNTKLAKFEKLGMDPNIESEDTEDGRWFDDEED